MVVMIVEEEEMAPCVLKACMAVLISMDKEAIPLNEEKEAKVWQPLVVVQDLLETEDQLFISVSLPLRPRYQSEIVATN